ncbi:MAG: DUF4867 family protein [Bacillota bacterium]
MTVTKENELKVRDLIRPNSSQLVELNKLNPGLLIKDVRENSFIKYGRVIEDYDLSVISGYLESETEIPAAGNTYQADLDALAESEIKRVLENNFYGEMPIEIGYCNGNNQQLGALEYHKGSEINIAVTDLVLLLGKVQDIKNGKYDSENIEAFYLKKGTAVEIYGTTLHFAPCKVDAAGFKCAVILPDQTNLALDQNKSDDFLFAKNKWLLAHPENKRMIEKGAKAAICGPNIKVEI